MKKYPPLNEQIKEFPIFIFTKGVLEKTNIIKNTKNYNHYLCDLHHFIKEQQYYRNPEKYKNIQKLILVTKQTHTDIHSRIRNFKEKYGIELSEVLYTGKR